MFFFFYFCFDFNQNSLRLVKVKNITTQVVAGMSYVITGIFEDANGDHFDCEISLWERAWLSGAEKLIVTLRTKEKCSITSNELKK